VTGEVRTFVATESRTAPKEWAGLLGPDEQFVQAKGHAESTILGQLGEVWRPLEGGTSRTYVLQNVGPLSRAWTGSWGAQDFAECPTRPRTAISGGPMNLDEDLLTLLRVLDRKGVALFAACCATRFGPVFTACAHDTPPAQHARWLDELWELVELSSADRASALHKTLRSAPEADVDDSDLPEFLAMRALSLLDYSAMVLFEPDPLKPAKWCSNAALSLAADVDSSASDPSPLEELEREAQRTVIAQLLEGSQPTADSCRETEIYRMLPAEVAECTQQHPPEQRPDQG